MNARTRRIIVFGLTVYICFVFIQSLFFKFADSPETQYIFGTLDTWAGSLGFPGLFAPKGIFSQYVVGSVELLASIVLLVGFFTRKVLIHSAGALISMGVISGAIFFHLFTPLGVQVVNADGSLDGGELFALACGVWLSSFAIAVMSARELVTLLRAMRAAGSDRLIDPGL